MHIKKGDSVIVLAGKDKGTKGKVVKVLVSANRVLVEGVNVMKRHQKTRQSGTKGQIIDITRSVHASNVQPVDPKNTKAGTRVQSKMVAGKRVRVAQKSGQEL
jgi:large subunit ribosomal protein L24